MGRGFAVVADEVRKLAKNTQKATSEISISMQTLQQETKEITLNSDEISKIAKNTNKSVEEFKQTIYKFDKDATQTAQQSKYIENKTFGILAKISQIIYKTKAYSDVINESIDLNSTKNMRDKILSWYENECKEIFGNTSSYARLKEPLERLFENVSLNLEQMKDGFSIKNIRYNSIAFCTC